MQFLSSKRKDIKLVLSICCFLAIFGPNNVFAEAVKKPVNTSTAKPADAVSAAKVNELIRQSWQLNLSSDLAKALGTAQNASSLAEKSGDTRLIIDSLDSLADIYDWNQKVAEQEPLRKKALELATSKFGKTSPMYARQLAKLASYYVRKGEQGQARTYLDEAGQLLTGNEAKEPLENACYYLVLARRQNSEGSFGLADDSYQKALKLYDSAKPTNQSEVLQLAKEYASLLDNLGRKNEAEKLKDRINLARATASVTSSTSVATSAGSTSNFLKLINEAKQAANSGDHGKSKSLWRLALEDAQKNGNDKRAAYVLVHLADEARLDKQEDEAVSLYRQSLSVREKCGATDGLGMARNLTRLAQCYMSSKKSTEAESLLRKAVDIEDKKDAAISLKAITLQSLLSASMLNKNTQQTEEVAKKLIAVSEKQEGLLGAQNKRMASSMLGAVYMQTGRMNEGIAIMKSVSTEMNKTSAADTSKAIMEQYNDADKSSDEAELKEAG